MDSRQFIESGALETYAMGFATEQEAKLVAEMVARYPEVKAELIAIEDSLGKFDQQNAVSPPAHLKAQILSKIKNVSGSQFPVSGSVPGGKVRSLNGSANGEVPKQSNFYKYATAAAVLLLLTCGYYIFLLRADLKSKDLDLATKSQVEEALRVLTIDRDNILKEKQNDETQIALLKKPGMKSVELKGMDVAPDAKAMAYANTKTGEVYLEIMNLPAVPDGMQYQFWGIVDNKPVDAGMIPTAENELAGIHPMTTVPQAEAYAISLEPMGGSQQPTGEIYVMGTP